MLLAGRSSEMQRIAKLWFITTPADLCRGGNRCSFLCRQGCSAAAGSSPGCEVQPWRRSGKAEGRRGWGEPAFSPEGRRGSGCALLAVDKPADGASFRSRCCQPGPPPPLVKLVWCVGCREEAVVTRSLRNWGFSSLLSPVALRTSSCLLQQSWRGPWLLRAWSGTKCLPRFPRGCQAGLEGAGPQHSPLSGLRGGTAGRGEARRWLRTTAT